MTFKKLYLHTLAGLLTLQPSMVQAKGFDSANQVGKGILDFLSGPFGVTVGALGIAAFGFLAIRGQISWQFAIAVIVGLVAIFGGAQFAEEIQSLAQ